MTRYFITGGGTGGHIYPAVAVADAVLNDDQNNEIFYVGNPANLEFDIVKSKNYKFLGVNVHGMPRKIGFQFFTWLIQLSFAVVKCCYCILKYKPNVVFGTGGYVSAPALIACNILGIPYMMHDCDAQPGLVTRKLAPHAKCISVAFESACKAVKNPNCKINGNPIRSEFKSLSKKEARERLGLTDKLTLCIMGGSQGARSINDAAVECLKRLSLDLDLQIIFQTGKKNFQLVIEQLLKVYPEYELDKNLIIKPYYDDMVAVLKASDIAVSRSGSLSISEICASSAAPVFIPYPHAAADHQRKNAKFMVEKNAAIYLEDNDLNSKLLFDTISYLVHNDKKLDELQENASSLAKTDAADKIVEQLKEIINGK